MPRGRSGGPPTRHQRDAYRARIDREAAAIILQDALETPRMTIRSGGHPREPGHGRRTLDRTSRTPMPTGLRPEDFDPYETRARGRNGRRDGGDGNGIWGVVKFLVFALVLAAVVLGVGLTVLRPVVNSAVLAWASDNPAALDLPFVADIVRDDIGDALTEPASCDSSQITFAVEDGDTASTIAERLEEEGLIQDRRAFVFIAHARGLAGDLQQGSSCCARNLTPDEMVTALLAPPEVPYVDIDAADRPPARADHGQAPDHRGAGDGRRRSSTTWPSTPPASLIADYPWLKTALADAPEGASLEGFLWPAAYRVLPDTTAEELVRLMLDGFERRGRAGTPDRARGARADLLPGPDPGLDRRARGRPRRGEAAHRRRLPEPRSTGCPGSTNKLLNADPTVI